MKWPQRIMQSPVAAGVGAFGITWASGALLNMVPQLKTPIVQGQPITWSDIGMFVLAGALPFAIGRFVNPLVSRILGRQITNIALNPYAMAAGAGAAVTYTVVQRFFPALPALPGIGMAGMAFPGIVPFGRNQPFSQAYAGMHSFSGNIIMP